jgi:hypothetical protein
VPVTSYRFPVAGYQLPVASYRLPVLVSVSHPASGFLRVFFYPQPGQRLTTFANPSQVLRKFAKKPKRSVKEVPKKLRRRPGKAFTFNNIQGTKNAAM